jgi:hypothetical protein
MLKQQQCVAVIAVTFGAVIVLCLLAYRVAACCHSKNVLTENFTGEKNTPQETVLSEYGVDHHPHMRNVALRCTGPSKSPLFINVGDDGVQLMPETTAVTRWNVYRSIEDPHRFTLALHSDPSMVLHTVGTEVRVSRLYGLPRLCWMIHTRVSSNAVLEVTIRGQKGYLGPSWSVSHDDVQGEISAGAAHATDWQKFSLVTDYPEADGQACFSSGFQECHWSTTHTCD